MTTGNKRVTAKAAETKPAEQADPEKIIDLKKILSRADILASDDLVTEVVEVPEWGGSVIVRPLTGSERDSYEAGIFLSSTGKSGEYNLQNIRAKLAGRTMIDEDGDRLFSDTDVTVLGLKSAAALDRVFTVAQRLSRLTNADVKELTDQLVKDQSVASGSVSPAS